MHIVDNLYMEDIPVECINECIRPGQSSDAAIAKWIKKLDFTVDEGNARRFVKSYGIDEADKMTDTDLAQWVLWIACGGFKCQLDWQKDNPGADPRDSDSGTDMINIDSY